MEDNALTGSALSRLEEYCARAGGQQEKGGTSRGEGANESKRYYEYMNYSTKELFT